jgi:hypothetical protein
VWWDTDIRAGRLLKDTGLGHGLAIVARQPVVLRSWTADLQVRRVGRGQEVSRS